MYKRQKQDKGWRVYTRFYVTCQPLDEAAMFKLKYKE